jgi:tRNA A-37 threonylcarbamoyl transferase component Bud32
VSKDPTSFGKYKIARVLGRGGMGIVYEAVDTALGRKVALKTMVVSPHANPQDAKLDEERFLREARLSAGLPKHPHIVGVYEVGVIDGKRYLAMELIEGRPMSDWRADNRITLRQEIEVLRTVALAVHHAHEHHVIHRDLKPANILIDAKNEPHITDFGLAKMIGEDLSLSLTGAGMVVGTPAYMSPEQAQGLRTTDGRTDVYALGVMLYETLTGRPPFEGATAVELLMKASKNAVPAASHHLKVRLAPVQAKGLDDICQKALAKKATERYRDAAAFAADLAKWLKGEEVKVLLQTRRLAPAPKKGNWLGLAAAAAFLIALAVYLAAGTSTPAVDPEAQARAEGERKRKEQEDKKEDALREAKLRAQQEDVRAEREKLAAVLRAIEEREKALKTPLVEAAEGLNYPALKPGLIGEYFAGTNFDILGLRRVDPEVNYAWKTGIAWPEGPAESISVRWSGYLRIPETGPYVVQARAVDGMRLFLGNLELLSNWMSRTAQFETTIVFLEKGHHPIRLEFFKSGYTGAGVSLTVKKSNEPGASNLDASHFVHDSSTFTPVARKTTIQLADRKSLPGAQEAESLRVLEATGYPPAVLGFYARDKGFLVWGKNCKFGDRLRLEFDSPETVERTLVLALGRAKNAGTFRVAVNGTVLAERLDLYFLNNHFLEHEFKKVALRKGANELEFVIAGSNPSAVEWTKGDGVLKLSMDYLRIR